MEIGCVDGVHPSLQNLCFKLLAFLSALARRKETLNFSGNRMRNRILWRKGLAQPDFKAWAKLFQVGVNKFPWLETSLVPMIPCVLYFLYTALSHEVPTTLALSSRNFGHNMSPRYRVLRATCSSLNRNGETPNQGPWCKQVKWHPGDHPPHKNNNHFGM